MSARKLRVVYKRANEIGTDVRNCAPKLPFAFMSASGFVSSQQPTDLADRIILGVSQLLPLGRFLPFWERFSGFVNFFKSEEHRKQIVLFANAPLTGKVEALLQPQHGFKTGDGFSG